MSRRHKGRRWLGLLWPLALGWLLVACGNAGQTAPPPTSADPSPAVAAEATATKAAPVVAVVVAPAAGPTAVVPDAPEPTAEPPLPAPPACTEPGRVVRATFPSQIEGPERPYRIYLPPCYGQTGARYPTLYLLHGNTRGDEEWDAIGIDEAADHLIHSGQILPLLIVMPNGSGIADYTSGGPWSYEAVILDELLPHIETTYCATAEAGGRAIGGLSRGGYWALEIAFRHPQRFAAVGGHAAALLDSSTDPAVNPIYTAYSADLTGLRIYLDYGAADYYRETTRPLHEHFTAIGLPHIWLIHPTGGHADPYWSDHTAEYLVWYSAAWQLSNTEAPACPPP